MSNKNNQLSREFEYIFSKFEKKEKESFNRVIVESTRNDIFIALIIVDLTYLNQNFNYDVGDLAKEKVIQYIELNKRKYEILHIEVVSGRILIYSKKVLDKDFFKDLNSVNDALKKDLEDAKLYPEEKLEKIKGNTSFYYKVNEINDKVVKIKCCQGVIELINQTVAEQIYLTELRRNVKSYIDEISMIDLNDENYRDSIKKLNDKYKLPNKRNIIKSYNLKYDFDIWNKKELKKYYGKIYDLAKDSKYITGAFQLLLDNDLINQDNLNPTKYLLIKFLIWVEVQKLQFEGYKIEKVYQYFYRDKENILEDDTRILDIVRFKSVEDVRKWYDSTIRVLSTVYLNEEHKKKIDEIKKLIELMDVKKLHYQNNDEYSIKDYNSKILKKLAKLVQELFDNLEVKGAYSIPVECITPSQNAKIFFQTILQYKFGQGARRQVKFYLQDSDMTKRGYYLFAYDHNKMYQIMNFWNAKKVNEGMNKVHLAFLEFDGFNAFNTYNFPNDTDTNFYKKMVDAIFEAALEHFNTLGGREKEIFSTITCSSKGDEFFFGFLSEEILSQNYVNEIIGAFMKKAQKKIVEIAAEMKFFENAKDNVVKESLVDGVITKNNVTFRKQIVKGSHWYEKDVYMKIGELGVSGAILYNQEYIGKIDGKNILNHFKTLMSSLESVLKKVKLQRKGSIAMGISENDVKFLK